MCAYAFYGIQSHIRYIRLTLRIIRQFLKYKISNNIFEVKKREHTIAISILNYHLIFLPYFTFQNSLCNFARIVLPQKHKNDNG